MLQIGFCNIKLQNLSTFLKLLYRKSEFLRKTECSDFQLLPDCFVPVHLQALFQVQGRAQKPAPPLIARKFFTFTTFFTIIYFIL